MHTRWNEKVIKELLKGTTDKLLALGVKPENIVVECVPGSYELPYAVSRMYAASQIQASTSTAGSSAGVDLLSGGSTTPPPAATTATKPFDAIVAIGCLIKGETMHFEYICESVSHALMRIQVDLGVPVVFGVLACLSEEQALARAGLVEGKSHNHGEDWGEAAVEMGVNAAKWNSGKF